MQKAVDTKRQKKNYFLFSFDFLHLKWQQYHCCNFQCGVVAPDCEGKSNELMQQCLQRLRTAEAQEFNAA